MKVKINAPSLTAVANRQGGGISASIYWTFQPVGTDTGAQSQCKNLQLRPYKIKSTNQFDSLWYNEKSSFYILSVLGCKIIMSINYAHQEILITRMGSQNMSGNKIAATMGNSESL